MANKSGIEIKKSHKGAFTKKAKAAGMSVQAFAKHVKAHPENYSGATRKQANFARVAKTKFKHQTGGEALAAEAGIDPSAMDLNFGQQQAPQQQASDLNGIREHYSKLGYDISGYDPKTGQISLTRRSRKPDYNKEFNEALGVATDVGNIIQSNQLKRDERLRLVGSMAPAYMQNVQQTSNIPAYRQMGGYGEPVGVIDSNPGSGIDDYMYEGMGHSGPYGQNSLYSGELRAYAAGGDLSQAKAKEILRDGTVHGKPLTDKQRRYFGWVAGGKKEMGGETAHIYSQGMGHPSMHQTGGGVNLQTPTGAQKNVLQIDPSQVQGRQDFDALDMLSVAVGSGSNPLQTDYGRVLAKSGPMGQGLINSAILFSQRPELKHMSPKERVMAYFNTPSNNPQVNAYKNKLKTLYSPEANLVTSPDVNVQAMMFKPRTDSSSIPMTAAKQTGGYAIGDEIELNKAEIDDLRKKGYKFEITK